MASLSKLEQLPTEIIYNVLSYLIHPRSRLPGLTERQSSRDCPEEEQKAAKAAYHLDHTAQPDTNRFAVDLFAWKNYHHPFNVLALVSRRWRVVIERFCVHLVKRCNIFNLPLTQAERYGPQTVYPDLRGIVFRRLWLQYAPRYCIYCNFLLSSYPHHKVKHPIAACLDCFYAQMYTISEVEAQFHLSRIELAENKVRGTHRWVLRVDVEALVLRLYGTKSFHGNPERREPCHTCLQAGTLARILALRARRESRTKELQPGSDGWIVKPSAEIAPQPSHRWFKYLSYRNDLYLYQDDEFDSGYHLYFYDVYEVQSAPTPPA